MSTITAQESLKQSLRQDPVLIFKTRKPLLLVKSPPIWVELEMVWVIFTKSWAIGSVELIDKVIRQILIPTPHAVSRWLQ